MKVSIERDTLLHALKLVKPAVAKGEGALFSLQSVKLEAQGNRLVVTANNLALVIEAVASAKVEEAGATFVPHAPLFDLLSQTQSGTLFFSTEEGSSTLAVKALSFEASLRGGFAEDFPDIAAWPAGPGMELDGLSFKRAVQRVIPACSTNESRLVLTAVQVTLWTDKVQMVATDGHRLAHTTFVPTKPLVLPEAKVEANGEGLLEVEAEGQAVEQPESVAILIPSYTLKAVASLVSDQPVIMHLTDDHRCVFEVGPARISTILQEAPYPNYEGIIPKNHRGQAIVPVEELVRAAKTCRIFSKQNHDMVKLHFDGTTLMVSGAGAEIGKNEYALEVEVDGAPPAMIALNHTFLQDALGGIGEEEGVLKFTDVMAPILISPKYSGKPAADTYFSLLMPMNPEPPVSAVVARAPQPPAPPVASAEEVTPEPAAAGLEDAVTTEPVTVEEVPDVEPTAEVEAEAASPDPMAEIETEAPAPEPTAEVETEATSPEPMAEGKTQAPTTKRKGKGQRVQRQAKKVAA